ncbi:hypothetical protein WH47_07079 [Habropoda laboriosa]|uniref:Uncharacterized protein n=1 Tax=Habropoda laboriosa TaxID=597456 RepID=A0A0L7RGB2_9HYME|nr:hypothetical protein WH47_07079 [Habropoda laboriosa]
MQGNVVSKLDKTVLDIASDIAVCNFDDGLLSIIQIMQVLGMTIGVQCYVQFLLQSPQSDR